jgi:hypothetical protein
MLKTGPRNLSIFTVIAIIGFILLSPPASLGEKPAELFSEDDATSLRYTDAEFDKETAEGEVKDDDKAPSIVIYEPAVVEMKKGPTIEAVTPINIYVIFKQNASPLDLETLDVWGEKFFFKKNLTSRVMPHIKTDKEGAVLHMKSIHVPKGSYKVGFKISDIDGRETKAKYKLKVE